MTKETNTDQGVNNVVEMDISDELQQIITDNMFWLKRRSMVRQADLAKSLGISQPTLSQKYSRTIAWTINDLAKAAVFFKVPVSYLVTDNFIEPSAEYQPGQNAPVDISRRELSAPAGARYLRKPDENEDRPHGAVGPRAFVMPLDVDQMNLGPRFSARTPFQAPPPGLEPRQRVPKTRVLPLHRWGMAETLRLPPSVYYATCRQHRVSRRVALIKNVV